jgi:hypothetical protein
MKKIISLLFFALLVNASFALTINQRVMHTLGATAVGNCSEVRMKVVYNTGGSVNTFATTSTVTISPGNYYDFSLTIPDGATIVSKTIEFSFSQSSNVYSFTVNGTVHEDIPVFPACSCPSSGSSDALYIQEIPTGRNAAVNYSVGFFLSGGC